MSASLLLLLFSPPEEGPAEKFQGSSNGVMAGGEGSGGEAGEAALKRQLSL